MEYFIDTEWDSKPISHLPTKISFTNLNNKFLLVAISAHFFNNPLAPNGRPGSPFPKLYDYEVVEIFFLAENKKYLEVEVSPHGQHLVLLLNGSRNIIKEELPLNYTSSIHYESMSWKGQVEIPLAYMPPDVSLINAYAIHGSGEKRVYEALYSVPQGVYDYPDFHRLEYFKKFSLADIVHDTSELGKYWENL
ncbi:UPF0462 protein C4orf33 homolog isoform X2 [Hydra vulgaris]|uniref:UPF0462 protein C4orf33 homolog isoform X2 n=1 Tax=Hydra vulgaris TaxID=6087 RepID=A0ABM4B3Z7_HYDVU